jgi:hypothetical protein
MSLDERFEKMAQRHEALAESVELGCLTILGVPAEIGHSEDCVPLPYGRGSECWY